ncbi:MAG: hypothetical protein A2840_02410 [Candidatus Buchananbacteria bacterium RIFCSPHIGHO2_01_FULL_47_11b]|uniref:YprB ribonuclease H-like domain-containing protein n=1 Tax=Candidatus Buchananbacteria bacterium RIFCSPHIGHO2_01_FULL_47_11b TaxID=1797537 RepID=A0A1G1Y6S8_9BACT|nr:MAG: hypothetical protein A2840_02410 [Candidatus Buchananbacteria bacterium RIFCSPHIGHO2_01_FULL_47_11b]
MNKIVFDIETKNSFADVGRGDITKLDISLLVIYNYTTDSYQSFVEEEFKDLWPILEKADLLIGFNSDFFDIPILNKYYPGDLTKIKSVDLLKEIKKSYGKMLPLDLLAAGTLGINKSGHGLEALRWWREGQIDKIRAYCQQDVKITKDLYDFALTNGYLQYKVLNDVQKIPLDTASWEQKVDSGINLTMPW